MVTKHQRRLHHDMAPTSADLNEALARPGKTALTTGTPHRQRRMERLGHQPSAEGRGDEDMIKQRTAPYRVTTDTVLLTFKEAMDFLRVSRSTLYRLMWSGQLRGHKVGSTWRFYESDLLAAIASPTSSAEGEGKLSTGEGQE